MSKHELGVILLGVLCLFTWSSCKENSEDPVPVDHSYFPLITGKYIIYDVDSIGYSDFFDRTDSSHYQVKEVVDSPYTDNAGRQAFKILRYWRKNENDVWKLTDVWSANQTDHTAEKVEENLRFIKLHLPIVEGKSWLGNLFIQTDSNLSYLDGWEYEYTEVHVPLVLNNLDFDSTVTVLQEENVNVIEQTVFIEKYARGVGLIYKYQKQLETQPGQYANGYIITTTVREYN